MIDKRVIRAANKIQSLIAYCNRDGRAIIPGTAEIAAIIQADYTRREFTLKSKIGRLAEELRKLREKL